MRGGQRLHQLGIRKRFIRSLSGVDRCSLSWWSRRGLLEVVGGGQMQPQLGIWKRFIRSLLGSMKKGNILCMGRVCSGSLSSLLLGHLLTNVNGRLWSGRSITTALLATTYYVVYSHTDYWDMQIRTHSHTSCGSWYVICDSKLYSLHVGCQTTGHSTGIVSTTTSTGSGSTSANQNQIGDINSILYAGNIFHLIIGIVLLH